MVLVQQGRFETMSDNIIGRNILCPNPVLFLKVLFKKQQVNSLNSGALDEMGNRIDDLERSIGELIQQAGVEEGDSRPSS
eukprot:1185237-Prorocentrum_minimum.AAC.7